MKTPPTERRGEEGAEMEGCRNESVMFMAIGN